MDCVSRHDRSILGINAQYCEEGAIQIKTLAMKEIYVQHTSVNLTSVLIELLQSYGVNLNQVYTITMDNAPNMICMGKIINERMEEANANVLLIDDDDGGGTSEGNGDDETTSDAEEDEFQYNVAVNDDLDYELKRTENCVSIIRCAAHTLNLAVVDFLKEIGHIRDVARKIAKKLRTPTLLNLLRSEKFRKPILECTTRWGSTYNMFKRLLELKEFCVRMAMDFKELNISNVDWLSIATICDILKPAYEISIKFQNKDVLLSDVFFMWYSCKSKIEQKRGTLSRIFSQALAIRGKLLLNNACILAAVYLDPRYQILLENEQKTVAKKHLLQVFSMKANLFPTQSVQESPESLSSSDELEDLLIQLEQQDEIPRNNSLGDVIQAFDNVKRLPLHSNILNYWKNHSCKQMRELAEIVLAIPATQVSVERAFSTLKFILSDLRTNIEDELLEDILLINLN